MLLVRGGPRLWVFLYRGMRRSVMFINKQISPCKGHYIMCWLICESHATISWTHLGWKHFRAVTDWGALWHFVWYICMPFRKQITGGKYEAKLVFTWQANNKIRYIATSSHILLYIDVAAETKEHLLTQLMAIYLFADKSMNLRFLPNEWFLKDLRKLAFSHLTLFSTVASLPPLWRALNPTVHKHQSWRTVPHLKVAWIRF